MESQLNKKKNILTFRTHHEVIVEIERSFDLLDAALILKRVCP